MRLFGTDYAFISHDHRDIAFCGILKPFRYEDNEKHDDCNAGGIGIRSRSDRV